MKDQYNPDPDICNKNAGMLMTGHLIFDASGNLVNQTAYTYGGNSEDMGDNNQYNGDPAALSSWQTTRFSSNGLPVFTANFTGQPLANTVNETTLNGKSQAQDYIIELDLGLRNLGGKNGDWSIEGGQSLEDIQLQTTQVAETVHKSAPISEWLYPDGSWDNDTGYEYYYQDKDGNRWRVFDITTEIDPDTGVKTQTVSYLNAEGIGQKPVTLSSSDKLYTKSWVEGPTKDLGVVTDKDFKPEAESQYYILQIRDDQGNLLPTPERIDIQIEGGILYEQKDDGTRGDAIEQKNFMGSTSLYDINIHQEKAKYTSSKGEPQIDDDVKENVLYRVANGEYDHAFIKDANGDWQLRPEAVGQALYIESTEMVTKSTLNFNDVATFAEVERAENATTAGNKSFITQDAGQNGYASGILSSTNITNDGVVYGYYDNGQTIPLYQIALYDFHNHQGLRREGGNLYAQTKESGEARQGVAGEAGFGVTRAYNIEQSNVDLSREFVNMITTQRGFQANSKGITTVDTMLETVIGMKR